MQDITHGLETLLPWRKRELALAKKPPTKLSPKVELLRAHQVAPDLALVPNLRELELRLLFRGAAAANAEVMSAAAGLKKLDSLHLGVMFGDPVPEELRALRKLRWLKLAAYDARVLPGWIGELTRLEALSLKDCPFRELPPEIGQLAKLKVLVLGGRNLEDVFLETLPPSIAKLTKVAHLALHEHRVPEAQLAPLLLLPRLRSLVVNGGRLPELVTSMPSLRSLALDDTGETELPAFIAKLGALEHLSFAGKTLRDLPAWLPKLRKLRSLVMISTQALDLDAFVDLALTLPKLGTLYLWNAATPTAKKKLLAAGYTVNRINWRTWKR